MMKRFFIVPILVCVSLTGCVPQYRQPLTMANRKYIKSDQAIIDTKQREINPIIGPTHPVNGTANPVITGGPHSMAVATGSILADLIVDLIQTNYEHHQIKLAEKDIVPIRNTLADFDYMKLLTQSIKEKLKTMPFLKVNKTKLKYDVQSKEKNIIVQDKKHGTTLFIDVIYALNYKFNTLFVDVSVELDQKIKNSKKPKIIFRNRYITIDSLGQRIKKRKFAVKIWDKDKGKLIKSGLKKSTQLIADMIAMDIKNPNNNLYKNMKKPTVRFYGEQNIALKAKIIKKIDGYYVVRTPSDILYGINDKAIKR